MKSMSQQDIAAAFLVIVVWAFNFIAAKAAVEQFPALLMLAIRFACVALLLAPFFRPLGKDWPTVALVSLIFGVGHFGLLFYGLQGVDAGPAAIAIQLSVPFSALLAAIVYREMLARWQLAGLTLAFVGVYFLAGDADRATSVFHFVLIVTAAAAWSVANVYLKRLRHIPPMTLNAWVAILAAPQLLAASIVVETGHLAAIAEADLWGWAAIAYMVIGASIIAYGLWYYLIGKYALNTIVPLMLLAPVLAVVFAVIFRGEPVTSVTLAGGAAVIGGVAMIQLLAPRPRTTPTP